MIKVELVVATLSNSQINPQGTMKIFLSHNHKDKPVVEPIALALKEIFDQSDVFYDDWSITPGESIIDRIDEGLSEAAFVFTFISENSIGSEFVKLEWQNALQRALKGKTKIIPVRTSSVEMPAILSDRLYIDLFENGVDVAVRNIVSCIQGIDSFTPRHLGFSNLTYKLDHGRGVSIIITASHLMEPTLDFVVCADNNSGGFNINGAADIPVNSSFVNLGDAPNDKGIVASRYRILGNPLTPGLPITLGLFPGGGDRVKVYAVYHLVSEGRYRVLPEDKGEGAFQVDPHFPKYLIKDSRLDRQVDLQGQDWSENVPGFLFSTG